MYIKRDILDVLSAFLKRKEYIAIIGPRQSGKTVLFELIKQKLIKEQKVSQNEIVNLNFEDRKIMNQFIINPVEFIKFYKNKYIFIDEFQYVKNGGQKLKLIYDTVPDIKIFITGSASLDIKAQINKYMIGRILTFQLFPFNFNEYLRDKNKNLENRYQEINYLIKNFLFKNKNMKIIKGQDQFFDSFIHYFEDYMVWGGYPAVVLEKNKDVRNKILNGIVNNYILKDIKGLLELATEDSLIAIATRFAIQIGNMINYNEILKSISIDYRNLKKHINILKETFICEELRPFYKNKLKELSKNPKIYFIDMGFRNNLIDDMRDLDKRLDAGQIAENVVYRRFKEFFADKCKLNYWRTKAGAEVDFVLNIEDKIIPVEVKYNIFNDVKLTRGFMSFVNSFNPTQGLIITKNFFGQLRINKTIILFIPIYYL